MLKKGLLCGERNKRKWTNMKKIIRYLNVNTPIYANINYTNPLSAVLIAK